AIGGMEAERAERTRQREEEREEQNRNLQALRDLQIRAREKRLQNYGPDTEPEFPPKLEAFRDEQLRKVDPALVPSHQPEVESEEEVSEKSRIEKLTSAEADLLELANEEEEACPELEQVQVEELEDENENVDRKIEELEDEDDNDDTKDSAPTVSDSYDTTPVEKSSTLETELVVDKVSSVLSTVSENLKEIPAESKPPVIQTDESMTTLIDPTDLEEEMIEETSASNKWSSAVRAWEADQQK
ncbi:hypothetical protein HDU76_006063, partial [Blyttiomyces sp. JEL0837]